MKEGSVGVEMGHSRRRLMSDLAGLKNNARASVARDACDVVIALLEYIDDHEVTVAVREIITTDDL